MDFAAIAAYLLGQAAEQHDTAARAHSSGDRETADLHTQAKRVYDEAAARLMALTAR